MVILLSLLGCGEKSSTTDTAITTDTSVTEEPVDVCAPIEGSSNLGMFGSVELADGISPVGNVRVQMCNADICYVAKWNDEGFCFPEGTFPGNQPYAFDIVPLGDLAASYANPLTILNPTAHISLDTPVKIPLFSHMVDSTMSELDIDGELTIQLNETYPQSTLSGVKINWSTDGLPLEGFEISQVVGGWYLGPFDTHLEEPLTFVLSNPSITAGSVYNIYNGNYEGKEWTQTGTITAEEDQLLTVESGIEILSTLLIIQQ